jgi:hypothetical protein
MPHAIRIPNDVGGRRTRHIIVAAIVLCNSVGCNHARYARTYDEQLPRIARVAVAPVAMKMYARHSGGVLERRTDLEPDLMRKTLSHIERTLADRGCRVVHPQTIASRRADRDGDDGVDGDENPEANADADADAGRLALLSAVRDAIVTHHYEHGDAREIDYSIGGAVDALNGGDADAVLAVYLHGVTPTGGRSLLKGTAVAVGALTGIRVHVSTHEALMILMLIDRRSGDILWFNAHAAETSVGGEKRLRSFVRRACSRLLKPRD